MIVAQVTAGVNDTAIGDQGSRFTSCHAISGAPPHSLVSTVCTDAHR